MTKLLYVKGSPRAGSRSVAVANAYLDALARKIPNLAVDTLPLWDARLPEFDGDKVAAKLTVFAGAAPEGAARTAWDEIVTIAERFTSAGRYLFAVPMWNNGIPYKLKQFIDLVHQPGFTFGFDPATGYVGLLKNKSATLVYCSGAYSPGAPSPAFGVDHHSAYMRSWLEQAGVSDITEIRYQPTLLSDDPERDLQRAKEAAAAAA